MHQCKESSYAFFLRVHASFKHARVNHFNFKTLFCNIVSIGCKSRMFGNMVSGVRVKLDPPPRFMYEAQHSK